MMFKFIYMITLLTLITLILWKTSKQLINFLITLEYFILTLTIIILLNNIMSWIFIIYIIFAICESIMGLALMISMNFTHGHQNIDMMNLCSK